MARVEKISFELTGDFARAFMAELANEINDDHSTINSKSGLARKILLDYLRSKGYDVEDESAGWGGLRSSDTEDEDQAAAVGVG